jgi:hypothetical protein
MAKPNKSLFSTIQDSLEIARWLRQHGWEAYIAKFLEEEVFIFILPGKCFVFASFLYLFFLFFILMMLFVCFIYRLIYPNYQICLMNPLLHQLSRAKKYVSRFLPKLRRLSF